MQVAKLTEWTKELLDEIRGLEAQLAPLQKELALRKEKLATIERLLQLEGHPVENTVISNDGSDGNYTLQAKITDTAYEILRKTGTPMYYRELCSAVVQSGVPISGKDPAINLIAKLGRDERFERVKRGTYALVEWRARRKRSVAK